MKKIRIILLILFCISGYSLHAAHNNGFAVGTQYSTAQVYVAPEDIDSFVTSLIATFGGVSTRKTTLQLTPGASDAHVQWVLTPAGSFAVFAFTTPIPYPFGLERTGYIVNDLDKAISTARSAGADVIVAPFANELGRNVLIQWPGGITMQLYSFAKIPVYPELKTIPEYRVYISLDRANLFMLHFNSFARGKIVADNPKATGQELGRPGMVYRRVSMESGFGKIKVMITDGHLPWPYGRESVGYEVMDLKTTLAKARAAGVRIVVAPFASDEYISAMVEFPGGYLAEIHEVIAPKAQDFALNTPQ